MSDKSQEVPPKDEKLIGCPHSKRPNLGELHAWMQPRTIRAEKYLVRPCAPHGLHQEIEAPNAAGVGVNVRIPR